VRTKTPIIKQYIQAKKALIKKYNLIPYKYIFLLASLSCYPLSKADAEK